TFYHFDCYRIEDPKEILDLEFKKIIENPQNIVIFEWGDKIKKILPDDCFKIKFEFLDKNKRKITIS
ncbi:MAG TPA: tRNA (adenosine(37)-N6)-threonylcarbamoyltransferase complex ATPase subunit type 1 TsaE, partial [Candidatus Pacearchaeota archaeon]|nr:tRNA (adenosine(37)-N6)-threonylcarbamoyltransferase complex ATPase subunit type 1 TsaE [Candidatus Pacearchaeota archaeon]HPZ74948.1 tRNA (adenosine(37)-N6)-threonylcarbamoyltransferase complex ATPase subunit type 1 TsaE [Candidatus Pacearchaeota archaeon]HQD89323.1 tRNA (adenosine(37)-N6)-threonylcarbamoyltransferase complex ATPase subunit type 1 TsaE [Candidatus Pacearchaeota archaeon]